MKRKPGNAKNPAASHRGGHFGLDAAILLCCALLFATAFGGLSQQSKSLPDFSTLDATERKAAFFDYLSPLIEELNGRTRGEREFVRRSIAKRTAGEELSWFERRQLSALARRYEVDVDSQTLDDALAALDRRIGIIPESLVLIQAAKESGWGTSRFAVEGNNLFGQRCFDDGCGIVPARHEDPNFAVAQFSSVEASIESYALNLNTHPRYKNFRDLRHNLRNDNETIKGIDLAQGLIGYSERGQVYVDEIKSMIRQNELE